MKFTDKEGWEKSVAANPRGYGYAVISFAQRWAELMEHEIEVNGQELQAVAQRTSFEANTEGITGFMYGAAVSILSQVWIYGEALRKWHNKDYNYDGEGTVNPAIITL